MKRLISYLLIFAALTSCRSKVAGTRNSLSAKQNTQLYKNSVSKISLQSQFEIFHINDTLSELYFKINSKELLYSRKEDNNFSCNALISYQLKSTYKSNEVLDSASVRLVDINSDANSEKYLIGKINVKVRTGQMSFLYVNIIDLTRNLSVSRILQVDKTTSLTRQNFLVKTELSTLPMFRNYIENNETVTIQYNKAVANKLYVSYYNRNFPLVPPPFSTSESIKFDYKPDSSFVIQLSAQGKCNFKASKKGFYHFQLDTTTHDGITLFNFSNNFPEIKKAEDMFYPLRFITKKEEYDSMTTSVNLKASIESFWMSTTTDKEKTREVIRKFYTRVANANKHFSSYTEGWRTDRGMIYIVFGAPNSVNKTENYETWTYAEETNLSSLTFSFIKESNPFTDNDYILERSQMYKQSWALAVDVWRLGRAYYLDE